VLVARRDGWGQAAFGSADEGRGIPRSDPPPLSVNCAPVLTVWAAVVAERLGHPKQTR
jgi:hypothetical protein